MCKHCGKPIKYNPDLQRYEHLHNNYDACQASFTPGTGQRQRLAGKRAEPV
jgi:hypothetical protein